MRSVTSITSFSRWLMRMTAMPSSRSWRISRRTLSTSRTASAAVGSSMMTSLGLKVSALAMATVCCWPPENRPTGRWMEGMRAPSRSIIFKRVGVHLRRVDAVRQKAEGALDRLAAKENVGRDIALFGERQILIDHLNAGLAALARVKPRHRRAVEGDLASVNGVQPGDGFHQSRFARAIVADKADNGSGLNGEIDAVQHLHRAEALGDAGDFKQAHALRSFSDWSWSI